MTSTRVKKMSRVHSVELGLHQCILQSLQIFCCFFANKNNNCFNYQLSVLYVEGDRSEAETRADQTA